MSRSATSARRKRQQPDDRDHDGGFFKTTARGRSVNVRKNLFRFTALQPS